MKKFLAVLFTLALFCGVFAAIPVSAAELTEDAGIDYTESTENISNPHRGYPTQVGYYFDTKTVRNDSGFIWYHINLCRYSGANSLLPDNVNWPEDRVDRPIDDEALDAFRLSLENLRNNGGSCFFRFVYDWDGQTGREPSSIDTIITHIEQLCAVVSDFEDVCLGFECGIIGMYGEMHSSIYTGAEHANRIIDAYLDNTPDSMSLMVRTPAYIANYIGVSRTTLANMTVPASSALSRLSYYNDGYMNTDADYGTWIDRALELKFLYCQSVNNPYGGEFGGDFYMLPNNVCIPENAIPEMYQTHLSFIRGNVYHSDNGYFGYDSYTYGPEYEKEWYPDNSAFYGTDCRTFIISHLGYRLVVRESKFSMSPMAGGKLTVSGKIENTGFGNVLHAPDVQILLVGEDNTYICATDIDAFDFKSCEVNGYTATFDLDTDMPAGDYKVYMRMASTTQSEAQAVKNGIKFANEGDIYDASLGANYLGTVSVTEYTETVAGDADDNGSVNIIDLTICAQFISGGEFDLSSYNMTVLDTNGDGSLDQTDLNGIASIIRNN